jgi:hypothetical protein
MMDAVALFISYILTILSVLIGIYGINQSKFALL